MEKTVTVSLKEFDELRKFKEDFENSLKDKNEVVFKKTNYGFFGCTQSQELKLFTENEAILETEKLYVDLQKNLTKQNKELRELIEEHHKLKFEKIDLENEIRRVRNFNIFEFLRWRKEK